MIAKQAQYNVLMKRMKAVDNKYGGFLTELLYLLSDHISKDGDKLFYDYNTYDLLYEMDEYIDRNYMNNMNDFIKFVKSVIYPSFKLSDIIYCLTNYDK